MVASSWRDGDTGLAGRGGGWGVTNKGYRVSFGGDGNVLKLVMPMVAHPYEHIKNTELYTLSG